ncbi:MAG: nucleoside triphosphate pyrophosphohydrolase [Bryobacteraceae bacterium]
MDSGEKFQRLVELMARLRAPDGCPWDREQTFETIKPFLLEETYEAMDAIDREDWPELAGELGDLLLQVVFFSQMAAERDLFRVEDALDAINGKLIRRHPHVFGAETAETEGDVRRIWGRVKAEEKKRKGEAETALLESVPRNLPALVEAQQIAARAAGIGFDWQNVEQVVEKLHEELGELEEARHTRGQEQIKDEIGDLLFVIVNIARFLNVDPEQALRKTNAKFRKRFGYMERQLAERGRALDKTVNAAPMEEMEELWREAKESE